MRGRLQKPRVKVCGFIMQVVVLDTNMGKTSDLTDVDRLKITSMLGNGKSTLEIAKNMNHHTVKKFVLSGQPGKNATKMSFEEVIPLGHSPNKD